MRFDIQIQRQHGPLISLFFRILSRSAKLNVRYNYIIPIRYSTVKYYLYFCAYMI